MARTVASLPAGSRITDYISLGVLAKTFPLDKVMAVIAAAGKSNQRLTGALGPGKGCRQHQGKHDCLNALGKRLWDHFAHRILLPRYSQGE